MRTFYDLAVTLTSARAPMGLALASHNLCVHGFTTGGRRTCFVLGDMATPVTGELAERSPHHEASSTIIRNRSGMAATRVSGGCAQ